MRKTVVGLLCIADCGGLFQAAFAAPAGPGDPVASIDPAAQAPPPPQVLNKLKTSCVKEAVMGSNVKRTTCRSQEEIDHHRAESKAYLGRNPEPNVERQGRLTDSPE